MKYILIRPLLVILSLLTISCGEDEDMQTTPQPVDTTTNPGKKCLIVETQNGTIKRTYTYDAYKRNTGIKTKIGQTIYITTNDIDPKGRPYRISRTDTTGALLDYTTYEFTTTDKISKRISYTKKNSVFEPNCIVTYQYDLNDNLIREDQSCSNTNNYKTYTYGSLSVLVKSYSASGNLESSGEFEYGSNKIPDYYGLNIPGFHMYSKNAELRVTLRDAAGNITGQSYSNSHQFNADGFPVQITNTFQNGFTEVWTSTYDCQ
jgi:hypothetical protein